ncbi:MAG: DUF3883 domain-containing protein [Oscillospiraceae bacterium]|nr:DUF3883 domain-containing protein [Oscillospiraceae bacterium]
MGKISSLPDDVRQEIIGYLAQPGIIASITAEVPAKKCADFEEKYGVTPYPINSAHKFGDQYRIYLSDPDDCPEVLKAALDQKYGRLNDTVFIRELVDEYGFAFFQPKQDTRSIHSKAKAKGDSGYESFLRGFNASEDFLSALSTSVTDADMVTPDVKLITDSEDSQEKTKKKGAHHSLLSEASAGLSDEQLLHLGWLGEQYFYNALLANSGDLLSMFGVKSPENCIITWFNNGFDTTENWEDKSVGKGCDIMIRDGDRDIYIEVKTSKRKSPIFAMTSFEMQIMQQKKNDYYLVKIDNMDSLISGNAPNVRIFASPYDYFFVPSRMYTAMFYNK